MKRQYGYRNRVDVFTRNGTEWALYAAAVLPSAAPYVVAALERDGDKVATFTTGRVIGRMVYASPGAFPNLSGANEPFRPSVK